MRNCKLNGLNCKFVNVKQNQTSSGNHYIRKCMASLESENTKLKTEKPN